MSLRGTGSIFLLYVLLISMASPFVPDAFSKTLYSYIDERGTRVVTDNYSNVPPAYRSRVTAVEQEGDSYVTSPGSTPSGLNRLLGQEKGFVIDVPGMSFQQSKVITYAGAIALLCILAMNLSRSEALRALALWTLLMTGICAPVLIYIADDGAATIMKKKAADIEQKQKDRFSQVQ